MRILRARSLRAFTSPALAALLLGGVLSAVLTPDLTAQGGDLESRYRAGVAAFQGGKTYEALELLGSVAAESPRYREVQMLLGQVCLVANLTRQAKQHFEKVLEADPSNAHAAFLLGFSLQQASRYFEADEALEKAHRLSPSNPHPLIYRGLALLRLGRAREAERVIEQALQMAPGEPTAETALAELELAQGKHRSAEQRIRGTIDRSPQPAESKALLGRILFEGGKPEQAAVVFAELTRENPKRSDLLYLHAQALLRSGKAADGRGVMKRFQTRKALEGKLRLLEAAVSTDPDDLDARIQLVTLLLDDESPQGALLHMAVLQKRLPSDSRVRALAGRLDRLRRGS